LPHRQHADGREKRRRRHVDPVRILLRIAGEIMCWPDKPDANNVERNFSGRPNQRRILMKRIRLYSIHMVYTVGLPGIWNIVSTIYVCMYVHIYVYMYMYVYMYVYTFIRVYVYIHSYKPVQGVVQGVVQGTPAGLLDRIFP